MTAAQDNRRAVVLVDAEHHPDAIRSALDALRDGGTEPVLALFVGGSEKVDQPGTAPDVGCETLWPDDPLAALARAVAERRPDVVIDRTADPVVDDRRRAQLASVVLAGDVGYEAPGAYYAPLDRPRIDLPAVSVVATGKRTGKTALMGALARHADGAGRRPAIVAMGRGGPKDPVVIEAGTRLDVDTLAEVAARGQHAASDFYEDAVMAGVTTIGCRRVGEGPTGAVGHSNVPEGLAALRDLDVDLALLEGSGAAMPPAHADATALVVPATADAVDLHAMLPLRFLLADVVVVTMADPRLVTRDRLTAVLNAVTEIRDALAPALTGAAHLPHVITRFRPTPLVEVAGRRVFVATTAPESIGSALQDDLAELWDADVVGITHALADRPRLRDELEAAPEHDLLLTELKAAGVDVAAATARHRGIEVAFYDNRPEAIDGSDGLERAFDALLERADEAVATRR